MSKGVMIVETGEVFRSAAECANDLRVSVGAVVHCLKKRQRHVAGVTVVYAEVTKTPRACPRRIVWDDTGRMYLGYTHIARVHGLTPAKARTMVLRNGGVFPVPRRRYTGDLFS